MEIFPKYISGFTRKDETILENEDVQNTYVNCNICRNFSNILKLSHRKSKEHQKKMTERFRIISKQIRKIGQDAISVHDEEWQKGNSLYCYFCDRSVPKHKVSDGLMIEYLGYITHLASQEHIIAVKKYLKYHQRNDNFETFCKTEEQLNKFSDKIFKAKELYLKNMELLHAKDVQSLRDIAENRKMLVQETIQSSSVICETNSADQGQGSYSSSQCTLNKKVFTQDQKVPPWQIEDIDKKSVIDDAPVKSIIGPTIETLAKHIASEKRKGLPVKRLGANIKHSGEYSANWMPKFRGVWNKGMRKFQMNRKNKSFQQNDAKK